MKIAIYCRVSEGQTVDKQLKACTDYAVEQNHEVIGIFTDVVKGDVFKRPAFSKMMEDASCEGILIYDVDRLTRDSFEYIAIRKKLNKQGKKLIRANEKEHRELDELRVVIYTAYKQYEIERIEVRRG